MAKFYVQSGSLELVLQAHDSRCAAIWAVHRTLSPSLPFLCNAAENYQALVDSLLLGATIRVSERGFDSPGGHWFDTLDVVTEWNQLLVALDRLQEQTSVAECGVHNAE